MATYTDLIQTLIKREMGIVGKEKTLQTAKSANISVADNGTVIGLNHTIKDLERLVKAFGDSFGPVAVIGSKVALMRIAMQEGLQLPDILK